MHFIFLCPKVVRSQDYLNKSATIHFLKIVVSLVQTVCRLF